MNKRYGGRSDIAEHFSELESMFNLLSGMSSPVDESMQVAILLVSIMAQESLKGTVAAIKTVDADNATWNYVSSRLTEEQRSQKMIVADWFTSNENLPLSWRNMQQTKCFKCGKRRHIAR